MLRSKLSACLILSAAATHAAAAAFRAPETVALPVEPLAFPATNQPRAAALPSGIAAAPSPSVAFALPAISVAAPLASEAASAASVPAIMEAGTGPKAAAAGAPDSPKSAESGASDGAARFDGALPMPDNDKLEKAHPLDFVPMQIPVGMREVQDKEKKLRGMDKDDQKKWLQEHAVPYVMRKGQRRPIDHHHETRAAWQAEMDRVYAYSAVDKKEQARLDALSDKEFWAEMKRRGWFYDKDQFGEGPRAPDQLPEDTRGHADDPFRSLAGDVRRRGGYDKSATPFSEFEWANFLRARVKTYPRGDAGYAKALEEALVLAASPDAKGLPGWHGGASAKK